MEKKKRRIVVALGGNALGNTLPEQMKAVKITSRSIVDLIEAGHEVVITHGNGPQVGMINNAMAALSREDPKQPNTPLSVCVAMSQAYIGYDLQNAMREELKNRGLNIPVTTMITQVRVLEDDPAFASPNKPIGHFMTKEQADIAAEKYGYIMAEDAGRGYRRMVASPKPYEIVEIDAIRTLVNAGDVVIACGGGGIPVALRGNHLKGQSAVIDKDFVSAKLAKDLNADDLIILTAVEKVSLRFGKPDEQMLDTISVSEAKAYIEAGEFAPGSMLPKVEAAVDFAASAPGRRALITLLEKAKDGIDGRTGTVITA
ncbi:MAG: carbamate kinase [Lachnospiraceae bacterium]|nr:carbamate kinase [Lachnospiraceae bacterium]